MLVVGKNKGLHPPPNSNCLRNAIEVDLDTPRDE